MPAVRPSGRPAVRPSGQAAKEMLFMARMRPPPMDYEPNDIMVLGAIRRGLKKFDKIRKATRLSPRDLNAALEDLENKGMIRVVEKKGWLGKKVDLVITPKGDEELDRRIHEMQGNWDRMVQMYKSKDKKHLGEEMDGFRGLFPMMIFFGVIDMMMFSMMFSMLGSSMTDYVPADQMPAEGGGADGGTAGDEGGMDGGVDSGFDGGGFDLGF